MNPAPHQRDGHNGSKRLEDRSDRLCHHEQDPASCKKGRRSQPISCQFKGSVMKKSQESLRRRLNRLSMTNHDNGSCR
jgi:hypothetical protein